MTTTTQANESSKSTKSEETWRRELHLMTDDGSVSYPDVADAAEVSEGRVQLVFLDGETEMVDGQIFATWENDWKLWMDTGRGIIHAEPVSAPILTLPYTKKNDLIKFDYDGYENRKAGRIKRLKRYDL